MKINIKKIEKLISDFASEKGNMSEEHIQTLYTIKLLESIGYNSQNFLINHGQDVKTGKKPDILLKNDSGNTLLVIESKDANKKDTLDGKYSTKTFTEQLFGYCKAEGVEWGILTNFIEWRVYSVHQKRLYKNLKFAFHKLLWKKADKNHYVDLLSEGGLEFLSRLSKPNLLDNLGRWDNDPIYYPQQEEIKDKFFNNLKRWRSSLRHFIKINYNKFYSLETIDIITQKIIDRLIFIDYCSDNKIIPQSRLKASLESKGNLHKELKAIFLDMDEKFNTELFEYNECDKIDISDEILRPIITELSNTDFSKLSVHVIGEVYEDYLGELLKSTKKGVRVLKDKTNAKQKNQGIYYTPDFIVDYIVKNTIGNILKKCKTIEEIEKIRILDPACGSGSFLIRAFDEFLLNYERIQPTGMFHFETRKKILQKNLFGVDLDVRAVEIAKLNLMIKALENTSHLNLRGRKLLPNLKLNIRCGNSLISGDRVKNNIFNDLNDYQKELSQLLELRNKFQNSNEDIEKTTIFNKILVLEKMLNDRINQGINYFFKQIDDLNPFNYSIAFPEIFKNGGFDCLVGNPPYIPINELSKEHSNFYLKNFDTSKGRTNTFSLFIESQKDWLKEKGISGIIVSNRILTNTQLNDLRNFILTNQQIDEIVTFGKMIFKNAIVDTVILTIKNIQNLRHKIDIKTNRIKETLFNKKNNTVYSSTWLTNPGKIFNVEQDETLNTLLKKIEIKSIVLGKICDVKDGIILGSIKDLFLSDKQIDARYQKFLDGNCVSKYNIEWDGKWICYDHNLIKNELSRKKESFKKIKSDSKEYKKKSRPGIWLRDRKVFEQPKIITRQNAKKIIATYDDSNFFVKNSLHNILPKDSNYHLFFILGILNSELMNFYFQNKIGKTGKIFSQMKIEYIKQLPILKIGPKLNKLSDRLIELVDQMLKLNKNYSSNELKIKSIDLEINKVIYKLYDISDKEILKIENFLK